jgi:hypothetical protein
MTAKLRRVIIAASFEATRPDQPTPAEMRCPMPGPGIRRRITTSIRFSERADLDSE